MKPPSNPRSAQMKLLRFARQLREYAENLPNETEAVIDTDLADYVAGAIERTAKEAIDLNEALGLTHHRDGAPKKSESSSDPAGFKRQQDFIFAANRLRDSGDGWKQIPGKIGYPGTGKQLEKLCREQADEIQQAARSLASRKIKARGRRFTG